MEEIRDSKFDAEKAAIADFDDDRETIDSRTREIEKAVNAPLRLMRHGVKLAMMIAGVNVSGFENRTVRIISPRFMPVGDNDTDKLPPVKGGKIQISISL